MHALNFAPQSQTGTDTAPGHDGTPLFYRWWLPETAPRHALVLFHGGHEHSGRFDELVGSLADSLPGCAFFAWDARGHGRSPGERGDADHFMELVRDADSFMRHIARHHGIPLEDMAVLGHSVGSVTVAAWLLDFAPPVRAAVLGSPAFDVKLYIPFARAGLELWQRFDPHAQVNSYVQPKMLTHDPVEVRARSADPLISPRISVRVLTSLYRTAERVIQGAAGIRTPLLLLSAGSDWVVHRRAQRRFFERLGSRSKEMEVLPGFYHEIFHEQQRAVPIARSARFLAQAFDGPRLEPNPEPVGRDGYQALCRPLPAYSPRRWGYAVSRLAMSTLGRLSHGVSLGWESGFESGRSLNHVYENRPRGSGPLGRLLDRLYLDSPGWRGIRTRGVNLRRALLEEIRRRRQAGRDVHILDVAGGPGRYFIDTLTELNDSKVTAQVRDLDASGLEEGRAEARQRGVSGLTYARADAFDPAAYRDLVPRPDILVISGLFELFEDNHLLVRALEAARAALPKDGTLIVTNQPWHPQLDFIARVLDDRNGEPWVMRPRPQSELEGLLHRAGFVTERRWIDDQGIFSVAACAVRPGPCGVRSEQGERK